MVIGVDRLTIRRWVVFPYNLAIGIKGSPLVVWVYIVGTGINPRSPGERIAADPLTAPTLCILILKLYNLADLIKCDRGVKIHRDFPAGCGFSFFGGDDDGAGCSTQTIESGSGTTFQHVDGGNVIGVDIDSTVRGSYSVDTILSAAVVDGYPIDDKKRLVVLRQ